MSKYNLTDIFEQYQIGSGFTRDFDFEGMLNAGLKTRAGDDIEKLKEIFDDFEDVNYHREAEHLSYAIDALENDEIFAAEGKISDFHAEIRKTMEGLDMDTSDDLGAYMASKMEEGEAVDLAIEASQEKAGIKEDEEVDEIAGYDRKGNKQEDSDGSDASKYKRAAMNIKEEEGFIEVSQDEIKMHLDQFKSGNIDGDDLVQAIEEIVFGRDSMEESFDSLAKKLDKQKGIDKDEAAKIAGSIAAKKAAGAGKGPTAKQKKRMSEGILKDVVLAIIKDTNATNPEVQMYVDSLTKDIKLNGKESYSDYEIDDYIEDFKNYVADKSLQEHFKRFK